MYTYKNYGSFILSSFKFNEEKECLILKGFVMTQHKTVIEKSWFTLLTALVQAAILYFLYTVVDESKAFAQYPEYLNMLAGATIAFPLILLFIRRGAAPQKALLIAIASALVIAFCGYYAGLQSKPIDKISTSSITSVYVLCSLIIAFKVMIYAQLYLSNQKYTFSNLYQHSWRTFIVGLESWIFTWLLFGILFLGAALFNIIGISVFSDLLDEAYITIPVFTLSFSFAINYFQNSEKVADTIASVLQAIIKFVLPLIAVILIGFAVSMLFTGIGSLWEDGPGSLLILWLQALALFFVNTVYMGTQKSSPYSKVLHKLVLTGIAFLPVYSVLASYGLWLRIDQYGLTPSRGFGMLVNLLIATFSFSYFVAIVKEKSNWYLLKNKINVFVGVAVVIICILLNTPILSMQKWSTYSQMSRLDLTQTIEDYDMRFFKNNLGASGYEALAAIKPEMLKIDISYEKRFNDVFVNWSYNNNYNNENTNDDANNAFDYFTLPKDANVPQEIINATFNKTYRGEATIFIKTKLDNSDLGQWVSITELPYTRNQKIWSFENGNWVATDAKLSSAYNNIQLEQFFVDPSSVEISVEEPRFKHLKIGNTVLYAKPVVSEDEE